MNSRARRAMLAPCLPRSSSPPAHDRASRSPPCRHPRRRVRRPRRGVDLKKADAEVVLIDRHDYHTFQPLLYQLATGLLEPTAVGHSLRDLVRHDQDNVAVHKTAVTAIDLEAREVKLADMEPLTYDFLVLGLGAEVTFFGTEGAAEHAFPMYTLADAVRLKEHLLGRWEAADKDPSLLEDGALNVVVVGGGPTGVESAGAIAELYRGDFARDYPGIPQEKARVGPGRGGAGRLRDVQAEPPHVRERGAREAHRRGRHRRARRVCRADPRHAEVRRGDRRAHARLGRRPAGQPARPVARAGTRARQPDRRRARSHGHGSPGGLCRRRHRRDHGCGDRQVLPQLGSVALQSGEHVGEEIARRLEGQGPKPFKYRDKGTTPRSRFSGIVSSSLPAGQVAGRST